MKVAAVTLKRKHYNNGLFSSSCDPGGVSTHRLGTPVCLCVCVPLPASFITIINTDTHTNTESQVRVHPETHTQLPANEGNYQFKLAGRGGGGITGHIEGCMCVCDACEQWRG